MEYDNDDNDINNEYNQTQGMDIDDGERMEVEDEEEEEEPVTQEDAWAVIRCVCVLTRSIVFALLLFLHCCCLDECLQLMHAFMCCILLCTQYKQPCITHSSISSPTSFIHDIQRLL